MLALLVESKKSTLSFTEMELDLILIFLANNLCEKMEYMPFIKKVTEKRRDIGSYHNLSIKFVISFIGFNTIER